MKKIAIFVLSVFPFSSCTNNQTTSKTILPGSDQQTIPKEGIRDYYLPDSPTNAIKFMANTNGLKLEETVYLKIKDSHIFKMDSKQMNGVIVTIEKSMLLYNDNDIQVLKRKSTNTLTGSKDQTYNTDNIILELPPADSTSAKWSFFLDDGSKSYCTSRFSNIKFGDHVEKVLLVTERSYLEPSHQCFGVTKYVYRKGKGLWNYKSLPCTGNEKDADVIEYKFQLAYHESEMDGLIDELE
jgi:hypothetical protein